MAKTRRAHSFRTQVLQGPTPLPPALLPPALLLQPAPLLPLAPLPPTPLSSTPQRSPPPLPPQQAPALVCLLRTPLLSLLPMPLLLVMLRVPPLWPLPRGDIILGLSPLHPLLHISGQPGGPHRPRGPGLQAQGSHLHRDPLHLIRVLPEPQTYLRGPSSGNLTSPVTPSRGMSTARGEISMGRCTMISRHLSPTRGSETPCSSYSDTIWSHSWCHVSTIILGSSLVLSYNDIQARGQPNCSSFFYRRQARDTSGLRYHSCSPSTSGPRQCGRL